MTIVLDGKALASKIKKDLAARVAILHKKGINPGLGTLLVGSDPASLKYVAGKHRDCEEVGINSIHPAKDCDGMHPYNLGELVTHISGNITTPLPCTPRGILALLDEYGIELSGKEVCVLGRGITVGRTIGLLLTRRGVDATVTLCHTHTRNVQEIMRRSDVIIAAMGCAGFVKPEDIKPGVVLVDVGVSRVFDEEAGRYRVKGDVDSACREVAGAYSPNPGGVGPMTRAMLLANVVDMAERAANCK